MAAIAIKQNLCIKGKYNALKEVEDDNSKSKVALKNTLFVWLKNKEYVFNAGRKGRNLKHCLREGLFKYLYLAILKWLFTVCSEDVTAYALIVKTKGMKLAKKINVKDFYASNVWLDDVTYSSKSFLVKPALCDTIERNHITNCCHLPCQNIS